MATANGFMRDLLLQSKEVFKSAYPAAKITPPGYLKYLLSNGTPQILSNGIADGSGHIRDMKVKFRPRVPTGKSRTTDDCSIDAKPAYSEASVNLTKFRAYSIFFDDADIAKYEKEASAALSKGNPATSIMSETWSAIIEAANGLFGDINNDLLTIQGSATGFGFNAQTSSNAPRTVNFQLATTSNDLSTGMTMVMDDAMLNELRLSEASIVGSGLINKYYLQNPAKGVGATGLDTSRLSMPNFYHDPYASTKWGANQFGIFEKNAVQFININRFAGTRGGDKLITKLGTITLPVIDSYGDGALGSFTFDYQLEYNKCPATATIGGYGGIAIDRGWIFTLMATYDQFNIPALSYVNTDRLYAGNGTLRYVATNS